MNAGRIVLREIGHRKASFALGAALVFVAVACLAGAVTMLAIHDLRAEQALVEKEAATRAEMARLEESYREIMRHLGYNVLVLHKAQDFADLQARGHPTAFMPEDYAERLGRGGIETLNHLLPILQEKARWPERGRDVFLAGIRGQVPVYHKTEFLTPGGQYRSPITEAVPAGAADLGFELARAYRLEPGDRFTFRGRNLAVNRVYPRRGNQDDITVWLDLGVVQEMLGRRGLINGILALECVCDFEALGSIEAEITRILPDVRVMEFGSLVSVRGEARRRAAETARTAIEAEKSHRERLRAERERAFRVIVPLVVIGAAGAIFFLVLGNVRERRAEIGILMAIGWPGRRVAGVILGRAFLLGVLGGAPGYPAGFAAACRWSGLPVFTRASASLFDWRLCLLILAATPLVSCLAGWLPALAAARQDPAKVLREQ